MKTSSRALALRLIPGWRIAGRSRKGGSSEWTTWHARRSPAAPSQRIGRGSVMCVGMQSEGRTLGVLRVQVSDRTLFGEEPAACDGLRRPGGARAPARPPFRGDQQARYYRSPDGVFATCANWGLSSPRRSAGRDATGGRSLSSWSTWITSRLTTTRWATCRGTWSSRRQPPHRLQHQGRRQGVPLWRRRVPRCTARDRLRRGHGGGREGAPCRGGLPFCREEKVPGESVTVSVGVASFPRTRQEETTMVHQTDLALYAAKQTGRNSVASAF